MSGGVLGQVQDKTADIVENTKQFMNKIYIQAHVFLIQDPTLNTLTLL